MKYEKIGEYKENRWRLKWFYHPDGYQVLVPVPIRDWMMKKVNGTLRKVPRMITQMRLKETRGGRPKNYASLRSACSTQVSTEGTKA